MIVCRYSCPPHRPAGQSRLRPRGARAPSRKAAGGARCLRRRQGGPHLFHRPGEGPGRRLPRSQPGGLELDAGGGVALPGLVDPHTPPAVRRHAPGRVPAEAAGRQLPGDRRARRRHQGHGAQDPGDRPSTSWSRPAGSAWTACCSAAPPPWRPRAATAWTWRPN